MIVQTHTPTLLKPPLNGSYKLKQIYLLFHSVNYLGSAHIEKLNLTKIYIVTLKTVSK